MKNIIKIVLKIASIGFLVTACGNVTRNEIESFDPSTPSAASYPGDEIVSDPQPEAGAPSVTTGGSQTTAIGGTTSIEAAGTGGTNDIAVGGEAAGGATNGGGAAGESSGGAPACSPRLIAEWNTHYTATACPGTAPGLQMLAFTLTAECQDMEVKRIMMDIVTPDFESTDPTPYCKAPCTAPSDWFFRNLKLQSSIGATLMGPMDSPVQSFSNDLAHITFQDPFLLKAGESKLLILTTDIAATFTSPLEETHYRALLSDVDVGNGNIPYVVVNNVSPDKVITVKQTCP